MNTPTSEHATALAREIARDLISAGVDPAQGERLEALVAGALLHEQPSVPASGEPADAAAAIAEGITVALAQRGVNGDRGHAVRAAVLRAFEPDAPLARIEPPPADVGTEPLSRGLARALAAHGATRVTREDVEAALARALSSTRPEVAAPAHLSATPSDPITAPAHPDPLPAREAEGLTPAPPGAVSEAVGPARPEAQEPMSGDASQPGPAVQAVSTRRLVVQFAGVAAAVAIAFLAQAVFDGRAMETLFRGAAGAQALAARLTTGGALYALAGVLIAIAAPALHVAGAQRASAPPRAGRGSSARRAGLREVLTSVHPLRALLFVAALVASGAAIGLYVARGEDDLGRVLWLLSLSLMVAAFAPWPGRRAQRPPQAEFSPPFNALHVAVLIVIVAAGFWLRFCRVETIPDDFHGDMASMGLGARDILLGREPNLFSAGWAGIQLVAYAHEAVFLRLFGNNLFGLNMGAVASGTLIVLGCYLLVWRTSDSHRAAALASAVLAINIPNIHFSRIATYIHPWMYGIWTMFFFVDGLRARRPGSFALAGLGLAFCVQMYFSGRSIAFMGVAFLAYALVFRRAWVTQNIRNLVLMGACVVVGLGPAAVFILKNTSTFLMRTQEVFLFNPTVMSHMQGMLGQPTVEGVVIEQTKRALLMFNVYGDTSTQFGLQEPMFTSAMSPFVVLGFFLSLLRIRRPLHALAVVWWLVILVIGAILTGEAPFWPRLQGMPIVGSIFAAIALDRALAAIDGLIAALGRRRTSGPPVARRAVRPAATLLVSVALPALYLVPNGIANWNHYYDVVKNNVRGQAFVGRALYALPPQIAACMFTNPMELSVRETAFLAYPRLTLDLPPNAPDSAIDRCPGPPFVWVITPNHRGRLEAIRQRWPDGLAQEYRKNGGLVFTTYLVAPGLNLSGLAPEQAQAAVQQSYPPDARYTNITAFTSDGRPFTPGRTFVGEPSSAAYEVHAGKVTVAGGLFVIDVAPVPGYNAVYDYVRLFGVDGREYKAEAEDAAATTGDDYAPSEGADGHWWLQTFDPFSGRRAVVAVKAERVPVLTTRMTVQDGTYDVYIGSFTGDRANGAFALGVTVR